MFTRMTTVVADVRFRAQTALVSIADCVTRAIAAFLACDDSDAANGWIWVSDCSLWADTRERPRRVLTKRVFTTSIWSCTLVDIEALFEGIS